LRRIGQTVKLSHEYEWLSHACFDSPPAKGEYPQGEGVFFPCPEHISNIVVATLSSKENPALIGKKRGNDNPSAEGARAVLFQTHGRPAPLPVHCRMARGRGKSGACRALAGCLGKKPRHRAAQASNHAPPPSAGLSGGNAGGREPSPLLSLLLSLERQRKKPPEGCTEIHLKQKQVFKYV
jgi:hypothetical protein